MEDELPPLENLIVPDPNVVASEEIERVEEQLLKQKYEFAEEPIEIPLDESALLIEPPAEIESGPEDEPLEIRLPYEDSDGDDKA